MKYKARGPYYRAQTGGVIISLGRGRNKKPISNVKWVSRLDKALAKKEALRKAK
jgi:hypothetical protein